MNVVRVLRGGWLVVLVAVLAGGAGGAASFRQQTPLHRSTVQLLVSVRGATTATDDTQNRSYAVIRAFGLAQIAMTRPALADAQAEAGTRSTAAVVTGLATLSDPFVRVEVVDPDATTARAIAAALATSLPRTAADLGVGTRSGVSLVTVAPASRAVPAAPPAWRYLLAGLAAGLSVGLALAVLREVLGAGRTDPEQVAALGGWPLLATVPPGPGVGVADPRSARAEAHRQVLTAALYSSPRGVRTLAVVGAGPGDGAADLVADLAARATDAGHDTVVLDDTAVLGRAAAPGRTGGAPDGADDARRLRELRTGGRQDLVVVDAGRLLPRPDRADLLAAADAVVVVVSWPQRHRVRAAARALTRLDRAVVGLVVDRGPVDAASRPRRVPVSTTTVPVTPSPVEVSAHSSPATRS